ncbi:MAG: response regulator transcription factor [Alphaproteobacteria bacterium]|nr:response regulator transcription factor [Alphaproteobacteria bacterium]
MISDASPRSSQDAEIPPARPRVALIDDDAGVRDSVAMNLEDGGFDVVKFDGGPSALAWFGRGESADLIVLDMRMPGMDGFQVLDRLRARGIGSPVVFLTALGDDVTEERALEGGAVDFVDKSRKPSILIRRLQLALDPAAKSAITVAEPDEKGVTTIGPLELFSETCRAAWNGQRLDLTLSEFYVVQLIATRRGADVSYREIYDAVRGKDFVAGQGPNGYRGNVRALIKRVRKKFRVVDDGADPIENYPGYGYRWVIEDA